MRTQMIQMANARRRWGFFFTNRIRSRKKGTQKWNIEINQPR